MSVCRACGESGHRSFRVASVTVAAARCATLTARRKRLRRSTCVATTNHQISFPVANAPSTGDNGGAVCQRHAAADARRTGPTAIAFPPSPMVAEVSRPRPACTVIHCQPRIDRLMTDPHGRRVGIVKPYPVGNLFWRPSAPQLLLHILSQRTTRQAGRSTSLTAALCIAMGPVAGIGSGSITISP